MDDVELITKLKKNMKPKVIALFDKILLRKRSIIETINDPLKNISQIEHSRHRSLSNCMINVMAGLLLIPIRKNDPHLREPLLIEINSNPADFFQLIQVDGVSWGDFLSVGSLLLSHFSAMASRQKSR